MSYGLNLPMYADGGPAESTTQEAVTSDMTTNAAFKSEPMTTSEHFIDFSSVKLQHSTPNIMTSLSETTQTTQLGSQLSERTTSRAKVTASPDEVTNKMVEATTWNSTTTATTRRPRVPAYVSLRKHFGYFEDNPEFEKAVIAITEAPGAEGIGMVFLIFLVLEGVLFFVMDAHTISKQAKMALRNIKGRGNWLSWKNPHICRQTVRILLMESNHSTLSAFSKETGCHLWW